MKKLLLSSITIVAMHSVSAQYAVTRANAPVADKSTSVVFDTLPQVSKGPAGANVTWNLSDFDQDVVGNPTMYSDASTLAGSTEFPDAELGIAGGFAGLGDLFYNLDNDKLEWLGIYGDFGSGPQTIRLSNTQIDQKYPSTYQSAYKDTARIRHSFYYGQMVMGAQVDSVRITYYNEKNVTYDAFGSVTTPYGSFAQSLRERAYTINEQKVEFCVAFIPGFPCSYVDANIILPGISTPRDTSVIYSWYASASSEPVARITYDFDDATIQLAEMQDIELGVSDQKLAVAGSVYPNPAKDKLYFKNEAKAITITDLSGRIVLEKALNGEQQLDISALSSGSYVISITSNQGLSYSRISVIK